ncbi:MAG: hypothetical protein Kow0019_01650 [Methanobacteriaceae archaeon]
MLRNRNSSIPDLRKKTSIINFKNVNISACIIVACLLVLLVIGVIFAAAAPNSNIPASFY